MIDLRSDTVTLPDTAMLETILSAPLGDDGRTDECGWGEDPTVNSLETICAQLTGKERALLCVSGTMGNQAALMAWCSPGEKILAEHVQHLHYAEKTSFMDAFGGRKVCSYSLDEKMMPRISEIQKKLEEEDIRLLTVENTNNYAGGVCITAERMKEMYELAHAHQVPVHVDGARLFNAAIHLGVSVKELCQYTDSVMICFSKGLGAPLGSILCGSSEFIQRARVIRKRLGGGMRQAGIIAAPALYALSHNVKRLEEDHENCRICAEILRDLPHLRVANEVQTNILVLDISKTGLSQKEFCRYLRKQNILAGPLLKNGIRLVFHKGISRDMAVEAAEIIKNMDD